MNPKIQSLCLKLGLRGIDEQKVSDSCSAIGHDAVLEILEKMIAEGPRRKGAIIELRIIQFSRMVKVVSRREMEKGKSQSFLKDQDEQLEIRNKERAAGFQPNAETLRAMLEKMYIQSGEISTEEYESAVNFLGVPIEERQGNCTESDIPF